MHCDVLDRGDVKSGFGPRMASVCTVEAIEGPRGEIPIEYRALSRHGFCICCTTADDIAATGAWISPSQAYAKARNIVDSYPRRSRQSPHQGPQALSFQATAVR